MFIDQERVGHVNSDLYVYAVWVFESGGSAESITIGMWTWLLRRLCKSHRAMIKNSVQASLQAHHSGCRHKGTVNLFKKMVRGWVGREGSSPRSSSHTIFPLRIEISSKCFCFCFPFFLFFLSNYLYYRLQFKQYLQNESLKKDGITDAAPMKVAGIWTATFKVAAKFEWEDSLHMGVVCCDWLQRIMAQQR